MSLVFIFAATTMESGIIERLMRAKTHPPEAKNTTIGRVGENRVVLVKTGMGPLNAKAAAQRALGLAGSRQLAALGSFPNPDAVLITGLAGSLVAWIEKGDIVIYQNCLSTTGSHQSIKCSPGIVESMTRSLETLGLKSKIASGISSPRIAQHDRDREWLAEAGGAVVDMESFEIAECSEAVGVPVAVVRAVSDSRDSHMPDLNSALNGSGEFNRWRLASALISRPFAASGLFRSSRRALSALERALAAILSRAPIDGASFECPAGPASSLAKFPK